MKRAAQRGLGPASRAAPFPIEQIETVGDQGAPLVPDGPLGGWTLHTGASMFLLREVEAANLRRSDVVFNSASSDAIDLLIHLLQQLFQNLVP